MFSGAQPETLVEKLLGTPKRQVHRKEISLETSSFVVSLCQVVTGVWYIGSRLYSLEVSSF